VITWVVGGGGLLGSAVLRQCDEPFASTPVPWADLAATADVLTADAARFQREVGDGPWAVIWAAGAATVSTSTEQAAGELVALEALLSALRAHRPAGRGAVFLASSAGGVYGGSTNPPFDIDTDPVPLSPYGELKLAQEQSATAMLADVCPLVIGRFSNLYGPGQNLAKLQGLISRLALAASTRQPLNLFVSLDTIRDYIYVDDAARNTLAAVARSASGPSTEPRMLIIASGRPATVGLLIRTMGQVTKRRVPVAYGTHASAALQSSDLRLVPSPDVVAPTSLPAGMKAAYLDILERVQQRTLSA
jgi:UDP-glucose 4-epimerase